MENLTLTVKSPRIAKSHNETEDENKRLTRSLWFDGEPLKRGFTQSYVYYTFSEASR